MWLGFSVVGIQRGCATQFARTLIESSWQISTCNSDSAVMFFASLRPRAFALILSVLRPIGMMSCHSPSSGRKTQMAFTLPTPPCSVDLIDLASARPRTFDRLKSAFLHYSF